MVMAAPSLNFARVGPRLVAARRRPTTLRWNSFRGAGPPRSGALDTGARLTSKNTDQPHPFLHCVSVLTNGLALICQLASSPSNAGSRVLRVSCVRHLILSNKLLNFLVNDLVFCEE